MKPFPKPKHQREADLADAEKLNTGVIMFESVPDADDSRSRPWCIRHTIGAPIEFWYRKIAPNVWRFFIDVTSGRVEVTHEEWNRVQEELEPGSTRKPEPTAPKREAIEAPCRRPASLEEVLLHADKVGVSKEDAEAWYRDREATSWCRPDGSPIDHWRYSLIMHRDILRSKAPPRVGMAPYATSRPPTIWELTKQREALQEQAKAIYDQHASESAMDTIWDTPVAKDEYRRLKQKIKELSAQIGGNHA